MMDRIQKNDASNAATVQQSFRDRSDVDTKNDHELLVVHCWSSPRSRSTAFMYSFDARPDTVCLDEPLYHPWLYERQESITRPYKDQLLYGSDDGKDGRRWQQELIPLSQRIDQAIVKESGKNMINIVFCKHMAKHYTCFNFQNNDEKSYRVAPKSVPSRNSTSSSTTASSPTRSRPKKHIHILLLRDPVANLTSWKDTTFVHDDGATTTKTSLNPEEVGTIPLMSIYSELYANNPVIIVDSDQLVLSPKYMFQCLCSKLQVPFTETMLQWSAGPKDCDGPWEKWWYGNVHLTTGWITSSSTSSGRNSSSMRQKQYKTLDTSMVDLLRLSLPPYQFLKRLSIGTMEEAQKKLLVSDLEDPRNANILCWIGSPDGGQLYPRDMAGISPFDSAVQGGDAVWEGLRVYRGKILTCNEHIGRLFRSAKAMGFTNVHTTEQVMEAIFVTLAANGMRDEAHIRLTLTRGLKCTSSMNPKFNLYGTTLIILPEWKCTSGGKTTYDNTKGITLITASQRRNSPQTVDSKIHHNNLINNILPKIQANIMGAADAIMLDLDGFVSETNATNIFMVDYQGTLLTPHADHCLPGITRDTVIALAKEDSIPVVERRISLAEFHAAEEVFTTGTMGGITPVTMIDGRLIGTGTVGATTKRLQTLYAILPDRPGWATELPPFSM